jgi:hypothetical protein
MKKLVLTTAALLLCAGALFAQSPEQREIDSLRTVIKKQQEELNRKEKIVIRDSASGDEVVVDVAGVKIFSKSGKSGKDSVSVNFGKKDKKPNSQKKVITNHLRLDLGLNNYLYKGSMTLPRQMSALDLIPGKSVNVNLHLFDQAIKLSANGKLRLYYGTTIQYNNYRFTENVTFATFNDSLQALPTGYNLRKNKLLTTYVTIPLGLQFESKPDKLKHSFRFAAGPTIGYLIGSHTKQVSSKEGKEKNYGDLNVEKLSYGLNAKIGYGRFNLYMNYSLSPLFQKGKGPELYPVAFGIIINDFDF